MKLIEPNSKYLESYKKAREEYIDRNIKDYIFSDPNTDIFKKFQDNKVGKNLPSGYVASSHYWLVDETIDEFIGEINIRHNLNERLLNYGGHIGYGIICGKWNKGYGTLMLKLGLEKAKQLGLDKVLITCDDDNYGSIGVIENNGGILENKVRNVINNKEVITRRYWIKL